MFAVIRWICLFAQRCGLQWFVLENVPGILKRKRKEPQSFGEWLAAKLVQELESVEVKGWQVRIIKHSSKDCLLPQHRPRVFFQGTSPDMRLTYLLTYCLSCLFIFAPLASQDYNLLKARYYFLSNIEFGIDAIQKIKQGARQ